MWRKIVFYSTFVSKQNMTWKPFGAIEPLAKFHWKAASLIEENSDEPKHIQGGPKNLPNF